MSIETWHGSTSGLGSVWEGMRGPGYSEDRMLGAERAFEPSRRSLYLRNAQPQVLALRGVRTLSLELGQIFGPPNLGQPARPRGMRGFNPSIAPAPEGLCPRCAYVVALRVDALHQCDRTSPLLRQEEGMPRRIATGAFFKQTALAVLDASLSEVLGWTWFLARPEAQLTPRANAVDPNASAARLRTASRWQVPEGAAGGFLPPWSKPVYDARLFSVRVPARGAADGGAGGCPDGAASCTRLLITCAPRAPNHISTTREPRCARDDRAGTAQAVARAVPA